MPSSAILTAGALLLALLAGCGRGPATIAELGLQMQLPPGWRTERGNPRLLEDARKPDDNCGLIEDWPAEGRTLEDHVAEITKLDTAAIQARQPRSIGGYPAIELVSEAEFALLEAVILKEDRVFRVSFRLNKADFPAQAAALRRALESIRFPPPEAASNP